MEGFGDTNIEIICAKCGGLIHLECRGMTQGKPDQLRAAAHQHGDRTCEGSYRELTIALALQPAAPKVREVRVSRLKNLGQYENEKVEMLAVVGEGEDATAVALQVEDQCRSVLGQPTRAVEEARKTVAKANHLWREAHEAARYYVKCDEFSRTDRDDAESFGKAVADVKKRFEEAESCAREAENQPEVIAARSTLGEEPLREVPLDVIRAGFRRDYGLSEPSAAAPTAQNNHDDDDDDGGDEYDE